MNIFNSLTRTKEQFIPRNKKQMKMYVCGITPYDTTHLGHAFTYIFFDVLLRYLRFQGYTIIYTQNVTDINDRDDDLLKRAKEQKIAWNKLANYWTEHFLHDMKMLNWVKPTHYLWASEHLPQMLKIIKELKKNQLTYEVNGGVYLDITKVKDFGKLSQLSLKEMPKVAKEFEEDVDNPDKKHPLDITLWRPTGKNQPKHIPSFQSLYGPGRPGWHLECSAMAICSLGEQIDIHGGGIDLMYPHHDSEIAQSEGATSKKPFAKYWIHTAPVRYKGEKMSKSLGNMVMISDLLKGHSANAIRFVLLTHHYRETWEFHEKELEEAQKKVDTIEQALKNKQQTKQQGKNDYEKQFIEAMDDDMNTPKALNVLVTMAKEGNDLQTLRKLFTSLGFV